MGTTRRTGVGTNGGQQQKITDNEPHHGAGHVADLARANQDFLGAGVNFFFFNDRSVGTRQCQIKLKDSHARRTQCENPYQPLSVGKFEQTLGYGFTGVFLGRRSAATALTEQQPCGVVSQCAVHRAVGKVRSPQRQTMHTVALVIGIENGLDESPHGVAKQAKCDDSQQDLSKNLVLNPLQYLGNFAFIPFAAEIDRAGKSERPDQHVHRPDSRQPNLPRAFDPSFAAGQENFCHKLKGAKSNLHF